MKKLFDKTTVLYTRREAAEILGVAPVTLAVWASKGIRLPYIKIGGSVRYRNEDINRFLSNGFVDVIENEQKKPPD